MKYRTLGSSDLRVPEVSLDAAGAAVGDVPVRGPRLAPPARASVLHRTAG
jgi:hypothetical protein